MRQWKTISSNEYVIDDSSREDILQRIRELSVSYTPEWQFDVENPDMGSVLALLFTDQMQDNLKHFNMLLERDYVGLINMLGISLKPAFPAHSIISMSLVPGTVAGIRLPKGTKLLGQSDSDERLVFETAHGIYVTQSRLVSVFMTSGSIGKVIPIKGDFAPVEYVEGTAAGDNEEMDTGAVELLPENPDAFELFDFRGEGYGKNGLLLYHSHLFDVQDNDICMEIKDADELVDGICNGAYRLYYYTDGRFEQVISIRREGKERIVFSKQKECKKLIGKEADYSVLLIEPAGLIEKNITVSDIRFSSTGKPMPAGQVWNGNTELDGKAFLPFGDTLSLFSELYIGHEYFAKPGSRVSITFDLDFETHLVEMPRQLENMQLKIIVKKPKKDFQGAPAEIYADEISIEYFNGTGWRKLPVTQPVGQLFGMGKTGACELSFICPDDWADLDIGGFTNKCIRIQLLRADNCYYQPALHHYPIIRNMQVSYTYEQHFERPQKIVCVSGSRRLDMTTALDENPVIPVFVRSPYNDTALYLGFDQKLEDGPVSMMFRIGETQSYQGGNLRFSYSTREGFSRLKLTDNTDGLSHTGTLLFMPPSDMTKKTIEGQEAYWIRITDEKNDLENHPEKRPVIYEIRLNAVEADNIDSLEESEYYIDSYGPDMSFSINAQNILNVDVWVNETRNFSESEMRRMLYSEPDRANAEYNFMGEIEAFYVKWEEVPNFDKSGAGDRHFVVDRMNSMLYFGDGVHVQIPKNTSGVAFKVKVSCCSGSSANVPQGSIKMPLGNLMFMEEMHNPIQAFGGMDMETMDEALRRGTTLLNSRNRLVSAMDYEREVLNFSNRISQVKAVSGVKKDGSFDAGAITLAILMEDYQDGSHSFINMRKRLREHLLTCCEMSVDSTKLAIVEPVFAEISVEAWVKAVNTDDTFEVQQSLIHILEEYLDPIKNNCWEIGRCVSESQIELRLNMEKGNTLIRKLLITAGYKDETGRHETDLKAIKDNAFIVVTSGKHKIHFES